MILLIDNYDSFVHNLARHMVLAGWETLIARNDKISISDIKTMKPEAIILSPGPCTPLEAGICMKAVKTFTHIPILGICLGHQCIGEVYGMPTRRTPTPMHGRASAITHNGDEIFTNVPETFEAGRYHSLEIENAGETTLAVIARTQNNDIMAVKHKTHPTYGLQFHPESILTPSGMQIIQNFSSLARAWNVRRLAA